MYFSYTFLFRFATPSLARRHAGVHACGESGAAAGTACHAAATGRLGLGRRLCSWPWGAHDGSRATWAKCRLLPCHCLLPGPPGLLHAFSRRASATWTPAAALGTAVSACQKSPISLPFDQPGRASKVHRERCRGRRRRDGDVRQRDGGHVGEEPRQTAASLSGAMALLDEGHLEDHPGAQERGKADQGGCVGAAACSTRLLGIAPARLLRLVVMGGVHSQGGGEASPPGAQTHLACSSSRLRPGRPDTPRVLEQPPPKSQAGVGVIRYGRIMPTVQ